MTVQTRQHVTDVFAVPVKSAEIARVAPPTPARRPPTPARTRVIREPPPRTIFVRPMPETGCECDTHIDDPVRTHLQDLINDHSHHLCVCSPNRSDMLRAEAEMKAHPGYADYKARRDAAMKGTRGARQ